MSQVNVQSSITPESSNATSVIAQLLDSKAQREAQLATADAQLQAEREKAKAQKEAQARAEAAAEKQQAADINAQAERDSKYQEFLTNRDSRQEAARQVLEKTRFDNRQKEIEGERTFLNEQANKQLELQKQLAILNSEAELAGAESQEDVTRQRTAAKLELERTQETVARLTTIEQLREERSGERLGIAIGAMEQEFIRRREAAQSLNGWVSKAFANGFDLDDLPEGTKLGSLAVGTLAQLTTPGGLVGQKELRDLRIAAQGVELVASRAVELLPKEAVPNKDAMRAAIEAGLNPLLSPEERVFQMRKAANQNVPEEAVRTVLEAAIEQLESQGDKRTKILARAGRQTLGQLPPQMDPEKQKEILEDVMLGVTVASGPQEVAKAMNQIRNSADLDPKVKLKVLKKLSAFEKRFYDQAEAVLGNRGVEVDFSDGTLVDEIASERERVRTLEGDLANLEAEGATDLARTRRGVLTAGLRRQGGGE